MQLRCWYFQSLREEARLGLRRGKDRARAKGPMTGAEAGLLLLQLGQGTCAFRALEERCGHKVGKALSLHLGANMYKALRSLIRLGAL